ncbi:MAG: hypothetical protein ACRDQZ_21625, partial [Mycobacteriales bacterium]
IQARAGRGHARQAHEQPSEHGGCVRSPSERGARRRHPVLVPLLATAGTLCVLVSALSFWVDESLLNSNIWATESVQLLQKPTVRDAVSRYVASQIVPRSRTQSTLAGVLPAPLEGLAAPAADRLQHLAATGVDRALTLPPVQEMWVTANRDANRAMVEFLRGQTGMLRATNGNVVLDLNAVVAQTAARLGISPTVAGQAPTRVQPIVLVHSDQLKLAQTSTRVLGVLSMWPLPVGILLWAWAVWLAGPRRRQAVRGIALGLVATGIGLLVLRDVVGVVVIDSLVKTEPLKAAAQDVWGVYSRQLTQLGLLAIGVGLMGIGWSGLTGATSLAIAVRRRLAPAFRILPLAPHVVLASPLIALLALHPAGIPPRTMLVLIVALTVLLTAGAEALRRQALREASAGSLIPLQPPDGLRFQRLPSPASDAVTARVSGPHAARRPRPR